MTMMSEPAPLVVPRGTVSFPIFLPDATLGVVRATDAEDLERVGVQALVMNVFHLMQKPGSSTIHALGGIHAMSGWNRPILTDSGGFQAYSLIRQNPRFGRLTDQGIRFKPEGAEREFLLTPEKSVQLQMAYGADMIVCLDDCTHSDDAYSEQRASVTRTIRWAKRCKQEFVKQLAQRRGMTEEVRPRLFGVVQGGSDESLRRECAEALLEIGFDGYGFGGYPLDKHGNLLEETLALTRSLIPSEFAMHALGVGHPESIERCVAMGYQMFDCALPTRDARSGRLYIWNGEWDSMPAVGWFDRLFIEDDKHIKTRLPLSAECPCLVCRRYSVGFLRHLYKCNDTLYYRLATLHNLTFMMHLMELLQRRGQAVGTP